MKIALSVPIITVALLLSLFVLPELQSPLIGSNLFIVAILLLLLFGDTNVSLLSAAVGGFIFDLVSPYPFGAFAVSFVSSVIIVRWVFRTRLTNRSLIAYLILIMFGLILQPMIAVGYSNILATVDSRSIPMAVDMSTLANRWFDVLRGLSIALIVYFAVRLTGRSYATLSSQEF